MVFTTAKLLMYRSVYNETESCNDPQVNATAVAW